MLVLYTANGCSVQISFGQISRGFNKIPTSPGATISGKVFLIYHSLQHERIYNTELFALANVILRFSFSESQSVSVNVGNSKEVKQETGKADGNQNNSNFTDNKQNIQTDQHCMNGGVATLDDVYTSELDVRPILIKLLLLNYTDIHLFLWRI